MHGADQQRSHRSTRWFLILGALAGGAFVVRYLVFVPVHVFLHADPEQLFADPASSVSISVREHNRLGFQIPLRHATLRCSFEEGADAGLVEYLEDSTVARLRATGKPGIIALRITTDANLFPMYFRIEAQPLIAAHENAGRLRIGEMMTGPGRTSPNVPTDAMINIPGGVSWRIS